MFKAIGTFFAMLTAIFAAGRNAAEALEVESENLLLSAIEKQTEDSQAKMKEWRKSAKKEDEEPKPSK